MRGRCDKQEFCLRSRAVYTAKRRLPSVSRACIFAAQSLFFPSQYQYFWVEIVWDKRWQVVHAWIHEPFSEFIKLMSPWAICLSPAKTTYDRRLTLIVNNYTVTCSVFTMDYGMSLYKLEKCSITNYYMANPVPVLSLVLSRSGFCSTDHFHGNGPVRVFLFWSKAGKFNICN